MALLKKPFLVTYGPKFSVYSRPLWGKSPPPEKKIQKPPNFKMNYAKIEFLSISGMIFSPTPPGLCPWS